MREFTSSRRCSRIRERVRFHVGERGEEPNKRERKRRENMRYQRRIRDSRNSHVGRSALARNRGVHSSAARGRLSFPRHLRATGELFAD
jgi:hypothetical protein